ncbi:spermatogenesis-associated serine-rich protein 2 isoform X1 [Paramormyrops kingsleyae]|uniref:Spermatosis associated serine rich 2 n=1 Tax=Paramormyrops kingsleyae TaxID=1676925 RepID=A0A3B3RWG3_9TELE|nr:spermatogenesis-associated serine-rich protein 2-like isoform X1 [Paramormyrops kingsleyae]XP_023690858.1 spermatogenesis-associated serine-rich protein 2-like isoform X1 [Paramormyrops kingsleyae]XP_023690859.1 spermatogenesis-associated serine-rich protein 2-like isoform X1 [Paramormyrops kingsleyae]XP_023690860.1 spermatogenesis-associated serine-rich protein 2-like isoform X1 [Paramormyrops kingsleyae]
MAKKNSQKDVSGVVFDTHSKMVMSQGGTFERMKEKINAVRAVVPNKSNNEIVLVLQHFDNCVDRAVQAFVEGSAADILKEWNVTGKKKPKKKKPKPQPEPQPEPAQAVVTPPAESKDEVNGFHANGSVMDGDSLDSLSEQLESASLDATELDSDTATPDLLDATAADMDSKPDTLSLGFQHTHVGRSHQGPRGSKNRPRPSLSSQQASVFSLLALDSQHGASANKKIAPNIDKSMKDLQRCTASLTRYRVVVKQEMDSSIKKMKQTFAELQSCLMDREVALLAEMDKVKAEATTADKGIPLLKSSKAECSMAILDGRQKRAEELRRLTDQSGTMSEDQLTELRADIKHFVSERKYDEDLGRAVKFTYEMEPLKKSIMNFGQVYHPQTGYSSRSRCSSAASSVTGTTSQEGPSTPQPQSSSHGGRIVQPSKQSNQGHRRSGQGLSSGGQKFNSGAHQDRNPNRTSRRNPDTCGGGPNFSSTSPSSPLYTVSTNGSSWPTSVTPQPDQPSNSLPQRPPRTRCP